MSSSPMIRPSAPPWRRRALCRSGALAASRQRDPSAGCRGAPSWACQPRYADTRSEQRAAALGSCHPTPERAPRLHVGQLRESRRRCRAAVAGRRPDRAAPSGAIVQTHGCARHPVGEFLGRALIPSTLTRGRASGEVGERFSKLAPTIYRSLDFIEPVHLQPELARLVFAAISQGPESVLFA